MVKKIIIACTLVCMTTMVSSVSLAKTIDKGQRGHHVSTVSYTHLEGLDFGRSSELKPQ